MDREQFSQFMGEQIWRKAAGVPNEDEPFYLVTRPFNYDAREGLQTSFFFGINNAPAGERAEEEVMMEELKKRATGPIADRVNQTGVEQGPAPEYVAPRLTGADEEARRPWKDCQIEEKLERLRVVADESAIILLTAKDELKYLQRRMARLERHLELMNDHEHGRNGKPVISADAQANIAEIADGLETLRGATRLITQVLAPLK